MNILQCLLAITVANGLVFRENQEIFNIYRELQIISQYNTTFTTMLMYKGNIYTKYKATELPQHLTVEMSLLS